MASPHDDMGTWSSHIDVRANPGRVLETLTDIRACEAWSPVAFEIAGREAGRLKTGSTVAVSGRIARRRVRFCVEIVRADRERLVLRAAGPVDMLADYLVSPADHGSRLHATISVRRGSGSGAGLAARATCFLLGAGALKHALSRIAQEAERLEESVPARAA
jgi:Polyketide cyclase / dehydrase and lipid transport